MNYNQNEKNGTNPEDQGSWKLEKIKCVFRSGIMKEYKTFKKLNSKHRNLTAKRVNKIASLS